MGDAGVSDAGVDDAGVGDAGVGNCRVQAAAAAVMTGGTKAAVSGC